MTRALAYDEVIRNSRTGARIQHPCSVAFDEASEVSEWLASLSREQRRALYDMLSAQEQAEGDTRAHDEPEPFPGRPTPGGPLTAHDAAPQRASFEERFPGAALIRVMGR